MHRTDPPPDETEVAPTTTPMRRLKRAVWIAATLVWMARALGWI
ncbi:hypothetical protein ACKVMT_12480 [Halobacteriales archaeon Cl-PHB]